MSAPPAEPSMVGRGLRPRRDAGAGVAVPLPVFGKLPGLGLSVVGCSWCRRVVGVAGADGLDDALAAHGAECPKRPPVASVPPEDSVCTRCRCEGELVQRFGGPSLCTDCVAESVLGDLAAGLVSKPVDPPRSRPRTAGLHEDRANLREVA
jgi:hypothetical protein